MSRETDISITSPHFPATKFCIARPALSRSNYNEEFYNVDRNDWSQEGTLWSYRSHAETVLRALQKAIDLSGKPSLVKNPCPCSGCKCKHQWEPNFGTGRKQAWRMVCALCGKKAR